MFNVKSANWSTPSEYDILHACGHKEIVKLVGKPAGLERQIRKLSSARCMDCRIKQSYSERSEIIQYFKFIAPDVASHIDESYMMLHWTGLGGIETNIEKVNSGTGIQHRIYLHAVSVCDEDALQQMAPVFLFHGDVDFWNEAFRGFQFSNIRDSNSMLGAFMRRYKKWSRFSSEEAAFYRAKEGGSYHASSV